MDIGENECPTCGETFLEFGNTNRMKIHHKRKHGESIKDFETSICEGCDEKFEHKPHEDRRFCSVNCMSEVLVGDDHPSWTENPVTQNRSPHWRMYRQRVLSRDGESCNACGAKSNLEVHHIVPYRKFGDKEKANQLSNLTTLCRTCHVKAEANNVNFFASNTPTGLVPIK